jgi:hypothetical protein
MAPLNNQHPHPNGKSGEALCAALPRASAEGASMKVVGCSSTRPRSQIDPDTFEWAQDMSIGRSNP